MTIIRIGRKGDSSDIERGMVAGARWADLSFSETADQLGFSHIIKIPYDARGQRLTRLL